MSIYCFSLLYAFMIYRIVAQFIFDEQDKSPDVEYQPPFGDRKSSNALTQMRGWGYKTNGKIEVIWHFARHTK